MKIKNDILVSLRHFKADKTNAIINITGLALGLGIVTVVLVFVINELGYNSSFANRDRIYRVLDHNAIDNNTWANTPYVLGETLGEETAEVEKIARQFDVPEYEIEKGDNFIKESSMLCTDESFFNIFGIKILQGSINGFDKTTGNIIISKSIAGKYFDTNNVIGKILKIRTGSGESSMSVMAVYDDISENSTIKASVITNSEYGLKHLAKTLITTSDLRLNEVDFKQSWSYGQFFTNYVLLKQGTSVASFKDKLEKIGKEHSSEALKMSFSLQPLTDIYFGSEKITDNNRGDLGNRSMLFILASVGILILIIACINYLNLTSAQALTQTKSLAIRKVCGAPRLQLMRQMIFESVLVSIIALPFAIFLAQLSMPFISKMLGKSYQLSISYQLILCICLLVLITIFTGALSGFIVSYKITSFSLVETLKGRKSVPGTRHDIRKATVVFQISVFIVLMAVMILVQKQVHYSFTKDLGFNREGLIRVPLGDHNFELFKQEIKKNPDVISVSGAMWMPPHTNHMHVSIPKVDEPDKMVGVSGLFVDYGFATTMGIKVLRGEDFDEAKINSGVLVNELAVKTLGLKDVIGERTAFGTIVGEVSDFNMYSLHEAVTPLIIGLSPAMCRDIVIRIKTDNITNDIESLKKTWKDTGGTTPFEFEFTNDILRRMYESDARFSKTIGLLALLAILIAGLGLFGLSLLISRQKTKEIGIRKVMGSGIGEVMMMLNREFVVCVAVAFIIAVPVAWYSMNQWLEGFAYRTGISWWIFIVAGIIAMTVAILTVSYQSYRAATCNPVEALRHE
ncbi:MAG TPA: ABC transporter permease [Bacteroidales bacterium]|nr:ABC transporter permease [Bacteroidales bacterium]